MKAIKSIIIGALVALVGSTAGAAYNATADLTMTDKDETIVLAPGANTNLTTVTTATAWNGKIVTASSAVTVQVTRNANGTAKISLTGGKFVDEKLTADAFLSKYRATVEIRSGSTTSGQGALVKTITVNLGEAIRLKCGESVDRPLTYDGGGRRWAVACEQGGSYVDVALDKTSETYSQYGYCLRTIANATGATLTMTGRDVGTETVVFGRQYETSSKKEAPKAMAIYYVTVYDDARTKIAVPTAATGLVWGITNQVGVAEGAGYERGGTYEASAVGEYAATVTPDDDHCWTDGKRDTRTIKWSIARRPATVTVCPATKSPNDPEPVFHTKNEGFLAADQEELVWTAWRTNTDETVGTYDIVIFGEKKQSGYDITYVGNTLTIENAPVGPTIPEDEGEITYDPETKVVVVTPKDATVTEVEIISMPADGTVKVPVSVGTIRGVEPGQVAEVFYTAPGAGGKTYDITSAFTISGDKASGVTVALDETASVMFDLGEGKSETITVTPTLTETGDEAVEPFEVATDEVDVGVKTIPGLTYGLKRSAEPGTVRSGTTVDEKQAEGLRTKLTDPMDGGRPEKAFYVIEVKK